MAQNLCKWKHFEKEIILLCVRWYLKYPKQWKRERIEVKPLYNYAWVHQYSPIIVEKIRKLLKPTNDSWEMGETFLKIKG